MCEKVNFEINDTSRPNKKNNNHQAYLEGNTIVRHLSFNTRSLTSLPVHFAQKITKVGLRVNSL